MPSYSSFLALSVLLLQATSAAVAHPALDKPWEYPNGEGYGNVGNVEIGNGDGYAHSNEHESGGKNHWGDGGRGACGKKGNGGRPWDNCDVGSSSTRTVSDCTTVTMTETLISTTSDCTATTTDLTTVTVNGPTITETTTTAGPTVTDTITEGASTVTEPGSTKTETVTDTITSVETTTYTRYQVATETETLTETQTLEVTTTVTASDCSETGGSNSLDYGRCSDPSIKWAYGLDGRNHYSFTTNNQIDFPFGSDTSIRSVTGLVCNRLRSPCNAPQATLDRCAEAANAANRLSGQEAADVWNAMMT
ncbi:uncharacterized protein N7515_005172 [Penicillium bovifimosum]|uniref:Uncharacterized protein n=1 Tax=Penicillium bovifimosum TaxID=126998 RepID=A0A9W9GSJ6_9EURO|nr:uncharacterized protein N7515_005172 [Penicillium bovifimosum]KAJ5129133.1 hypothetical protein N7515_005172 [Penicillium bovifimosum]